MPKSVKILLKVTELIREKPESVRGENRVHAIVEVHSRGTGLSLPGDCGPRINSSVRTWVMSWFFLLATLSPVQKIHSRDPKDQGTWQAIVHGVTKSRTRLSD